MARGLVRTSPRASLFSALAGALAGGSAGLYGGKMAALWGALLGLLGGILAGATVANAYDEEAAHDVRLDLWGENPADLTPVPVRGREKPSRRRPEIPEGPPDS